MKIGEFAKKHGISIDTVRFYVNEGLLIPMRDGYHYQFDQQCSTDLENIFLLKNAGFSLRDIKTIVLSQNLSVYAPEEYRSKCQDIFLKKLKEIEKNIGMLKQAKTFIEERMEGLSPEPEEPPIFGASLNILPYLACPHCGGQLMLKSTMVEQGKIVDGSFTCPACHYVLDIREGILTAKLSGEVDRNFPSFDCFITQAEPNLMASILQNVKWMKQYRQQNTVPARVILEVGSGFGFFLRETCNLLSDDVLYFAVDNDINRHLFLKKALQNSSCTKNIVLLCCDIHEIPLKPHIVDQVIDFGTATDLAWYRPEFTLDIIDRYTHKDTDCIFANRAYEKFDFSSPIKPESRKYLEEKYILEKIESLHYRIIKKERMDFLDQLQPSTRYMNRKDKIYKLLCYMKKEL